MNVRDPSRLLTPYQSAAALAGLSLFPLVRRYAYEMFLWIHRSLTATAILALWIHLPFQTKTARLLIIASGSLSAGGLIYRLMHQAYGNMRLSLYSGRRCTVKLQMTRVRKVEYYGTSLILELALARPWTVRPNQHVHLTVLTFRWLSLLQRHPFTIAWWSESEHCTAEGEERRMRVYLMVAPQRGWTRRIMSRPLHLKGRTAWLGGPFGAPCDLSEYGTVLLFASGDGMFAMLPVIKEVIQRAKHCEVKARRIQVVWYTNKYHGKLREWLESMLKDENHDMVSDQNLTSDVVSIANP